VNELFRRILFLPEQGSTVAPDVDALHYFVIGVTMAGAAACTLVGAYLLARYRRGRYGHGEDEYGASALSQPSILPLWVEVGVIGGLLLLFLFIWWLGFRQYVRLRVPPEDAQEVYVVGKKWMWEFAHPEGGGSIGVLTVPANRPIKLVITSRDVIHSFFVPDFRIKQDAVPGRYTTAWFEAARPGAYEILCTEYCGAGHSTMRGTVVALGPEDYERWLAGTREPAIAGLQYSPPAVLGEHAPREPLDLPSVGMRKAAQVGCLRCHSLDGTPHIGPSWAGTFGQMVQLTDGTRVRVDEAYLTESMMDPRRKVRAGFTPVMPPYHGILAPGDVAALVELIRSLRSTP
jgi:cytochrome c oxidase subunit II